MSTKQDLYLALMDKWKDHKVSMTQDSKKLVSLARSGDQNALTELAYREDRKKMKALAEQMDNFLKEVSNKG